MKLKAARIETLARQIVNQLENDTFIETNDKTAVINGIIGLFLEENHREELLDEDVRKILDQYSEKMDQDRIQYHEIFKMVKEKLAKERKFIL